MVEDLSPSTQVLLVFVLSINLWAGWVGCRFLRRLREEHESTWIALHRPHVGDTEYSEAENSLFVFVISGQFRKLKDQKLTDERARLQIVMAITCACVAAMFFYHLNL